MMHIGHMRLITSEASNLAANQPGGVLQDLCSRQTLPPLYTAKIIIH